jgi:hypothetical protein
MDKQQRRMNIAADLSTAITSAEVDVTLYMPGEDHEMTAAELRSHIAGMVNAVRVLHSPVDYAEAPLPPYSITFKTRKTFSSESFIRIFEDDNVPEILDRHHVKLTRAMVIPGNVHWPTPKFPKISPAHASVSRLVRFLRKEWTDGQLVRRRGPSGEWRWMKEAHS